MQIQITNLHPNLVESDLRRLFTPYGEIEMVTLERDARNNRSRGKALLHMPVEAEARNAILQLNGTLFGGKKIIVESSADWDEETGYNGLLR